MSSVSKVSTCRRLLIRDADRNVSNRPVLKHGPRSLTYVRVMGDKPRRVMKVRWWKSANKRTIDRS